MHQEVHDYVSKSELNLTQRTTFMFDVLNSSQFLTGYNLSQSCNTIKVMTFISFHNYFDAGDP